MVSHAHGRAFGHPIYHPIYEAAHDLDLPVAIHVGGELGGLLGMRQAGGQAGTRVESHAALAQAVQHDLVSFVVHGVFEKFPRLRLILIEGGVAWIPWLMAKMDGNYELLRHDSPFVKRRPSEYIRDHVRFTTQPMDEPPKNRDLVECLEALGGFDELLCFASDYPHWDTDALAQIEKRLPEAWRQAVFYENARLFYRFPSRVEATPVRA
jgi:predicted TIM-barrel fold metal-dependent hydrolase